LSRIFTPPCPDAFSTLICRTWGISARETISDFHLQDQFPSGLVPKSYTRISGNDKVFSFLFIYK
jgi:hypothetical protein